MRKIKRKHHHKSASGIASGHMSNVETRSCDLSWRKWELGAASWSLRRSFLFFIYVFIRVFNWVNCRWELDFLHQWPNGGILSQSVKFPAELRRVWMSSHSCRVVVVCCTLSVTMPCDPRYVSCARGQFWTARRWVTSAPWSLVGSRDAAVWEMTTRATLNASLWGKSRLRGRNTGVTCSVMGKGGGGRFWVTIDFMALCQMKAK